MVLTDPTASRPDFLVIGEQKCGTAWIRDRLREHPGLIRSAHPTEAPLDA